MSHILAAALEYARKGIPVFPLRPGTKLPMWHGSFHHATTDPDVIRSWFPPGAPEPNIGTEPAASGLTVFDIDDKNGHKGSHSWAELTAQLGLDPETCMVQSPSGGKHAYYADPDGLPISAGKLGDGIDIRSRGGYVLLPPSRLDEYGGAEYVWLKAIEAKPISPRVREALAIKDNAKQAAIIDGEHIDSEANVGRARAKLEQRVRDGDVAIEGQGGDDRTFRLACEILAIGLSEETALELIAEIWNPHCQPPWELSGGTVQAPSLDMKLHNAAHYMQNQPGATGLVPGSQRWTAEEIQLALDAAAHRELAALKERWRPRTAAQAMAMPPIPYWDAEKMWPRHAGGGVGMVYGPGGSHKTNVIVRKLFNLWHGDGERPRVLYATGEGDEGFGARLTAQCLARGVAAPGDELFTLSDIPIAGNGEEIASFARFAALLVRPHILIIDTWATALNGMKEDEAAAALLTRRGHIGELARQLKCFVLVVHHTGKDEGTGPRGASGFVSNIDVLLRTKASAPQDAETVELWCERMKDGASGHRAYYEITKVGGVPVPTEISYHVHQILTGDGNFSAARVVATLHKLQAFDVSRGVPSFALVQEMFPRPETMDPEEWQGHLGKLERKLLSKADRDLAGLHNKRDGGGKGGAPVLWFQNTLPNA